MGKKGVKVLARNKKARHDYEIEETFEAGIVLTGTEIKSIRAGKVNLQDSFARIMNEEVFLLNMHVSPFEQGNRFNQDPTRTRKLLLHKDEIKKLVGKTQMKGYALIPLDLHLRGGFCKVELALAKGKKLYDKRRDIAKRDAKREMERAFKDRQRQF